jgi:uncharacterized membrane protein YeaQ/YmgE (transglycosylase-associated protein family)
MNRMNGALLSAVTGVIGIVVIETLVTSITTTGWDAAVSTFIGTLVPIVFSACIIIGLFKYFAD